MNILKREAKIKVGDSATEQADAELNLATINKESESSTLRISVVIPVYNTMPYLTELLNSLEFQSLPASRFEVIAVDDGSTDFSGEILDVYAKRNTNFRIIHQENSGWPGKPRNVGIDEAYGEWVFFCDGDDVLGKEALARMLAFAEKHDVDILIPKMIGLNGRRTMASLYRTTSVDTPLEVALRSLNPTKMMRRSLLIDNKIRFREERVRLEDGMFVAQAYMHANRISILSDYDYYHSRIRSDGQNISISHIEPSGYVASLSHIAETITSNVRDKGLADQLIAGLFSRKALRFYEGKRFLSYNESERREWITEHVKFLRRFLPGNTLEFFSGLPAERVGAILQNEYARLVDLAETDTRNARKPELVGLEATSEGVRVRIRNFASNLLPSRLVIDDRDNQKVVPVKLAGTADEEIFAADMPSQTLADGLVRLGNVGVAYGETEVRRVIMSAEVQDQTVRGVRYYRTANGFFSVDVRKANKKSWQNMGR